MISIWHYHNNSAPTDSLREILQVDIVHNLGFFAPLIVTLWRSGCTSSPPVHCNVTEQHGITIPCRNCWVSTSAIWEGRATINIILQSNTITADLFLFQATRNTTLAFVSFVQGVTLLFFPLLGLLQLADTCCTRYNFIKMSTILLLVSSLVYTNNSGTFSDSSPPTSWYV